MFGHSLVTSNSWQQTSDKQHPTSFFWLLISLVYLWPLAIQPSHGSSNFSSWASEPRVMVAGHIVSISSRDASQGYLASPNYPKASGFNTSAVALLSAEPESHYDCIRLTFMELDLEESNFCETEVVELLSHLSTTTTTTTNNNNNPSNHNNHNKTKPRTSKSHSVCGKSLPLPFLIKGKFLMVYFVSDAFASGRSRGFRIKFEFLNYFAQTFNGCPLANHYKCRNRRCIPNELKCNRRDDCGDASDEDRSSGCQNLPTIAYPTDYRCGLAEHPPPAQSPLTNRINGGSKWSAALARLPFQVSIQQVRIEPVSHTCGGTLIHPMFVLTAAHCFKDFSMLTDYRLLFGATHLPLATHSSHHQVRYPSFISLYPGSGIPTNFQDISLSNDHSNDLALIELNAPVQLQLQLRHQQPANSNSVWPICLPHLNEASQAGRKCLTSGYGDTHGTGSPLSLKHVAQTIEHERHCSSSYSNFRVDDYNMICVRSQLGRGPCNGDSGGPLFCADSSQQTQPSKPVPLTEGPPSFDLGHFQPGQIIQYLPVSSSNGRHKLAPHGHSEEAEVRFTVHGITSFTTDGNTDGGYCGLERIPIIYARVSTKVEWILSKMKMALRRLSKDDNQEDSNNRSSLFGYMFRSGRSRLHNNPPLMTVDGGDQ